MLSIHRAFRDAFTRCLLLCALALVSTTGRAADSPPMVTPEIGPKTVSLGEQGSLQLPAGYVYLNSTDAAAMLTYWGNPGPHKMLGLVLSQNEKDSWAIGLRFLAEGYVKDEDAKTWDAEELFDSIKEGTEASNEERKRIGGGEMHILDWVQKPTYDAATHRLAWGLRAEAIQDGQRSENVNYRTYVLGREGFIEMNLMTDPQALNTAKPRAQELLNATQFNDGKRYEDFQPGTDRVAEYGLAALVAGGVAKKVGLFAAIGLAIAKFWKLLLLGLVFFGGTLARFFKRKTA